MTATLHTAQYTSDRSLARTAPIEPNYALRRAVVGLAAALLVVLVAMPAVAVLGTVTGFGGRPAAASEATPAVSFDQPTFSIHVAERGDSLWSIAEAYRGDVGRSQYVDALIDLNGGIAIQAGQAVRLP